MESIGKVIAILPAIEGVSASTGNPWKAQTFVIETQEQYPKKQAFDLFGEDRIKNNLPQMDAIVKVSFDLESRETKGRWFTSARAYKVEPSTDAAPLAAQPLPKGHIGEANEAKAPMPPVVQPQSQNATPAAAPTEESTGLPF